MLQNAKVAAFTISQLLRKTNKGVKVAHPPPHTHTPSLGLTFIYMFLYDFVGEYKDQNVLLD